MHERWPWILCQRTFGQRLQLLRSGLRVAAARWDDCHWTLERGETVIVHSLNCLRGWMTSQWLPSTGPCEQLYCVLLCWRLSVFNAGLICHHRMCLTERAWVTSMTRGWDHQVDWLQTFILHVSFCSLTLISVDLLNSSIVYSEFFESFDLLFVRRSRENEMIWSEKVLQ